MPSDSSPERIRFAVIDTRPRLTQSQRWILVGLVAVAVFAVIAMLLITADDDEGATTTTTTSSSTTTTSSSTTSTTTTTSFESPVDAYEVAFPSPNASQRFDDPEAAARTYATDVLGYTTIVADPYAAVTDDEGTVTVRARRADEASSEVDGFDDPPPPPPVETDIRLRRLEDDSWYVMHSSTDDIVVDTPTPGASLATPFETRGQALAFEGTVDVVVWSQEGLGQLGSGFVTGSGVPPAGPFSGRIFFSPPEQAIPGILVYRVLSADDGRVEYATSFPVRLTSATAQKPPEECGDTEDDAPTEGARVVKVFFHCGTVDADDIVAMRRTVPADDPRVLSRTIDALLAGPTAAEREAGFTSPFPIAGLRVVDQIVIDGGVATIDLSSELLGVGNGSHTILTLRSELFRTASQFSSVAAIEVLVEGSCEDFAEWSQSDSCLIAE